MIAKNAAATLAGCLASVAGLVDAIVLVDTGSSDGTVETAKSHGAQVILFPWRDDFSAARNAALAAVETDWVLVLDADEELDRAAYNWIRQELRAPRADGYVTPVRNYLKPWEQPLTGFFPVPPAERHPRAPDAAGYLHSEVCRLYRRDPDIYYIGHVHEQVEYRLMQLGRPIGRAGFFIHHFGWYLIDEPGLGRKRKLYHDLLAEKARQRPDDAQVLLQYGDAQCAWSGKHREGLELFMKAAAMPGTDSCVWLYIASALLKLNQMEGVLIALNQASEKVEHAGQRALLRGEALGALKRWKEAGAAFRVALDRDPDSIQLQAKLALLEMEQGETETGTARMQKAIAAAELQASRHRHAHPCLYAAELHAQLRQWEEALRLVKAGLRLDPELLPLHELGLRAAVAIGKLAPAEEFARRIAMLNPSPRSVLRHAAVADRNGNRIRALEAIADGLERFPDSKELRQAHCELSLPVAGRSTPYFEAGAQAIR